MDVSKDTDYIEKENTMLVTTAQGMKFHQHRLDEMRKAADKARLIADLRSKDRSSGSGHSGSMSSGR